MVDEKVINDIRSSIDIVDVISGYIKLIPKGKNYFGVCPFHDDNNPSMSVSKDKQIYRCFSCGASGNVFKFIMDYENVNFKEALKKCASLAGISLSIDSTMPTINKHKELYDMYELSNKLYQNNLMSKEGTRAKEYLSKRGITDELIKTFKIGLSLDKSVLVDIFNQKYQKDAIIKTGLISKNEYGMTDIYKNRIMFPLFDLNNNIVGYSGRIYEGNDTSKYINTKETEIFKKGELIYNYVNAKDEARKINKIIVVEGFMDVIALYKIGIKNVVATMGTAVTKEQTLLIKRLAKEVILCFDGDNAGAKANYVCANELIKVGVNPKIIKLKDELDPDEYINKYGEKSYKSLLDNPLNIMDYKLEYLKTNKDLSDSGEMAKYVNDMISELNLIDDDILRELTLKKLSDESNLDINMLRDKLTKKEEVVIIPVNKVEIKESKYQKAEKYLIYYMLKSKDVIRQYDRKVTYMPTGKYRKLARMISIFYDGNKYINEADLITQICDDDELMSTLNEILDLNLKENYTKEEIDDYINVIKDYNIDLRIKELETTLKNERDDNEKLNILNEILKLRKGDSSD